MNIEKKSFAFKLADKGRSAASVDGKWKAREGVSLAGCTEVQFPGNYRQTRLPGSDNDYYC